jgi:hypothetical protein
LIRKFTTAGALKYDVTAIAFSQLADEILYAAGMDYEVICGRWEEKHRNRLKGSKSLFSFRGDSRWHGLTIQPTAVGGHQASGELLVGMTESCIMAAHAERGGADAVATPALRMGQAI